MQLKETQWPKGSPHERAKALLWDVPRRSTSCCPQATLKMGLNSKLIANWTRTALSIKLMRLCWMAPFKLLNCLSGCHFQRQVECNWLHATPPLMQKERHTSTALDSLDTSIAHKQHAELAKQLRTFAQERSTFSTISHTSCNETKSE